MLSSLFSAYPSFLVFLGFIVATALTMALMPAWIRLLTRPHIGQQVRADGPQSHLVKQGTPTMGGVIMLIAIVITRAFGGASFVELRRGAYLRTLCTAALGLFDDAEKVIHERSLGLTPKGKLHRPVRHRHAVHALCRQLARHRPHRANPVFAAVEFRRAHHVYSVPHLPRWLARYPSGCTSCSAICLSSACPMR